MILIQVENTSYIFYEKVSVRKNEPEQLLLLQYILTVVC